MWQRTGTGQAIVMVGGLVLVRVIHVDSSTSRRDRLGPGPTSRLASPIGLPFWERCFLVDGLRMFNKKEPFG